MEKIHLYDKILYPLVTEKTTNLSEQNKVVFKVPANANKKNLKINIPKYIIVFIISLAALILLADTFKFTLEKYLPGINFILNNLYETLKDLTLFFKDLIN